MHRGWSRSRSARSGANHRARPRRKKRGRTAALKATVRLIPTGLLTPCATPATSPPRAASFFGPISEFWFLQIASAASASSRRLAHFQFVAVTDVERNGDDVRSRLRREDRQQLTSHCRILPVESGTPGNQAPGAQPACRFRRSFSAPARHQVRGGRANRILRLDAEMPAMVHQHIAQVLVLDVDHRGHGVDHP